MWGDLLNVLNEQTVDKYFFLIQVTELEENTHVLFMYREKNGS